MKFKHWWWYIIKPKDFDIDYMMIEISAAHPLNIEMTKRLIKEFNEKYFIVNNYDK